MAQNGVTQRMYSGDGNVQETIAWNNTSYTSQCVQKPCLGFPYLLHNSIKCTVIKDTVILHYNCLELFVSDISLFAFIFLAPQIKIKKTHKTPPKKTPNILLHMASGKKLGNNLSFIKTNKLWENSDMLWNIHNRNDIFVMFLFWILNGK